MSLDTSRGPISLQRRTGTNLNERRADCRVAVLPTRHALLQASGCSRALRAGSTQKRPSTRLPLVAAPFSTAIVC